MLPGLTHRTTRLAGHTSSPTTGQAIAGYGPTVGGQGKARGVTGSTASLACRTTGGLGQGRGRASRVEGQAARCAQ